MKTIAIVQARLGSSRLPGKVMMDIHGKPMIDYVVERVMKSDVADVVIASPQEDYGSILDQHTKAKGWNHIFAENAENVAGRFTMVLEQYPCDAFVRVCADSPLIDPQTVNRVMRLSGHYRLHRGICGAAEYLETRRFLMTRPKMGPYNREHVTTFWRASWEVPSASGLPKLTVDTLDDLERIRGIVSRMTRDHLEYGDEECLLLA